LDSLVLRGVESVLPATPQGMMALASALSKQAERRKEPVAPFSARSRWGAGMRQMMRHKSKESSEDEQKRAKRKEEAEELKKLIVSHVIRFVKRNESSYLLLY